MQTRNDNYKALEPHADADDDRQHKQNHQVGAEALARIESVVAIDPQFRSAYASLKEYNKKYVGMGNGYWRGQTSEKLIALTLDDGPNPLKYRTPALLDMLRTLQVKATFFIVGARAEANPDLIQRMDAEGHEIANHSYSHPNLTFLTPDLQKFS